MRVLLDTHLLIWAVEDDPRLTHEIKQMISICDEVYVSSASLWEAAIKFGRGKLSVSPAILAEAVQTSGFIELPIHFRHADAVVGFQRTRVESINGFGC